MNKTTVERLTEVKTELTKIDNEVSALKGRKQQLLEDLESRFNFTTIEEADKHIIELSKEIEEKDIEINKKLEKLDKSLEDSGIKG